MRQKYEIRNNLDENLNPAGGWVHGWPDKGWPDNGFDMADNGMGIDITWQDGPLKQSGKEVPPNGAFVEDVLEVCQRRIEFYQASKFACPENAQAIAFIQNARDILASRIARREAAGVQGTHEGN